MTDFLNLISKLALEQDELETFDYWYYNEAYNAIIPEQKVVYLYLLLDEEEANEAVRTFARNELNTVLQTPPIWDSPPVLALDKINDCLLKIILIVETPNFPEIQNLEADIDSNESEAVLLALKVLDYIIVTLRNISTPHQNTLIYSVVEHLNYYSNSKVRQAAANVLTGLLSLLRSNRPYQKKVFKQYLTKALVAVRREEEPSTVNIIIFAIHCMLDEVGQSNVAPQKIRTIIVTIGEISQRNHRDGFLCAYEALMRKVFTLFRLPLLDNGIINCVEDYSFLLRAFHSSVLIRIVGYFVTHYSNIVQQRGVILGTLLHVAAFGDLDEKKDVVNIIKQLNSAIPTNQLVGLIVHEARLEMQLHSNHTVFLRLLQEAFVEEIAPPSMEDFDNGPNELLEEPLLQRLHTAIQFVIEEIQQPLNGGLQQ